MTDITVIILVGREEIHIRRCLQKLAPLEPRQIVVVESQEGDRTHEIAVDTGRDLGWAVRDLTVPAGHLPADSGQPRQATELLTVFHAWPGNQAAQFNWVLDDQVSLVAPWILRLDADEYLTDQTIEILRGQFGCRESEESRTWSNEVTAYSFELGRTFLGRNVSRGVGRMWLVRLFRTGIGRSDKKSMDEHIVVSKGRIERLTGAKFIDDNLNGIDWWTQKHLGYAEREAQDVVAGLKNGQKGFYYRLPRYWRALAYFCYRYFLRGGFLEGKAGFTWHFFQGFWYRCLVDYKIGQLESH